MVCESTPEIVLNNGNSKRITGRRVLFSSLVGLSIAALLTLAAMALSANGIDALDVLLLVLFAVTLPW